MLKKTINPLDKNIKWVNGFLTASQASFLPKAKYSKFLLAHISDSHLSKLTNSNFSEIQVRQLYNKKFSTPEGEALALGALYSEDDKLLIISRDLFSTVPLYYVFIPNLIFAFSTSLTSLLKSTNSYSILQLSVRRIKDYSSFGLDNAASYDTTTFFDNVKTLLPGHTLSVTPKQSTELRNVNFNVKQYEDLGSLGEYAEVFKNHFLESVKGACEGSSLNLGAHLSGGLDSSSIASVVRHLYSSKPIQTFYYDVDDQNSMDHEYSLSVAREIGSVHHIITPSTLDFRVISKFTKLYGHPEHGIIAPTLMEALLERSKNINCDIVLSGHGGDSVVGSGFEVIAILLHAKQWNKIAPLLRSLINYASIAKDYDNWETLSDEKKYYFLLQRFLYKRLTSKLKTVPLIEGISLVREVSNALPLSYGYFAKKAIKSLLNRLDFTKNPLPKTLLNAHHERNSSSINSESLSQVLHGELPDSYRQWFDDVFIRQSHVYRDQMFTLGTHYDISNRFPFFNKKLFEICMCVPLETKFGEGKGREHFRESMKGILLETVRIRHDKQVVGNYGRESTLRLVKQANDFVFDNKDLWEFYDKKKYLQSVDFLKSENQPLYLYNRVQFQLTHAVSLAIWLNWLKNKEFLD